jgi:hypothetical protein
MTVQFPGTKSRAVPIPDIMMAFKLKKKCHLKPRKLLQNGKRNREPCP